MYFVVGTVCTIYQELNLPVTSSFYDYIYYQYKKKNVSFSCTCQMDATTYGTITCKFVVKNLKLTLLFF